MKQIVIALLCALPAAAQSAKVVQLSDIDAARAQQLANDRKTLESEEKIFHDHIMRDYLVTTKLQDGGGSVSWSDPNDKEPTGGVFYNVKSFHAVSGGFITYGGSDCETPSEKAARKKQEAADAAWAKAHPIKWIKHGWDNEGNFQFSDDYRFIVPVPASIHIKGDPTWVYASNQ